MAVGWFFLTSVVLLHFLELQPLPDRKTDWNCLPEASLCGYASSDLVRESILPIYQLHQLASRIRHIAPSPRGRKYYTSRIRYYANSDSTFHQTRLLTSGDVSLNPGPITTSGPNSSQNKKESLKSKLSCVSFNSRSIVNKRLELSSLLALKSYELVAITETFLDSTINSSEIFSDTFNVQRRDRSRHGGGVLLAVHQGLCCIRRTDFETDCEILWCELIATKPFSRVLVGVFYRPPSSDIDYLKE